MSAEDQISTKKINPLLEMDIRFSVHQDLGKLDGLSSSIKFIATVIRGEINILFIPDRGNDGKQHVDYYDEYIRKNGHESDDLLCLQGGFVNFKAKTVKVNDSVSINNIDRNSVGFHPNMSDEVHQKIGNSIVQHLKKKNIIDKNIDMPIQNNNLTLSLPYADADKFLRCFQKVLSSKNHWAKESKNIAEKIFKKYDKVSKKRKSQVIAMKIYKYILHNSNKNILSPEKEILNILELIDEEYRKEQEPRDKGEGGKREGGEGENKEQKFFKFLIFLKNKFS